MVLRFSGSAAQARRRQLKKEFWPAEVAWRGPEEKGYFCSPRSLPLVLLALSSKAISGEHDPSPVYVELLSRHHGQGVIEMGHEDDHAYAAGYTSNRAVRTWRDRMKVLEDAGFIRTSGGARKYSKVLLVHPSIVMKALYDAGKIDQRLWEAYRSRQIEVKEASVEDLRPSAKPKLRGRKGAA
jgi:hypothetical protein